MVMFSDEELQQMRNKLNAMSADNQRLKEQLAAAGNKTPEKVVEKSWVAAPHLVTFQIGESRLSNEARVNLGFLAKVMKENNRKVVYTIIGYADKGTGSRVRNERLSKARAEAVYDCLVNEFGVPVSILKVTYEGGVDNMFYDDPRLSRAVITEAK
jgi:outer membrane protein OmpA-like peptidoglycan-associated protein